MDDDIETLEGIREMEEEAKRSFKSMINRKNIGKFEMDMLFFEDEE